MTSIQIFADFNAAASADAGAAVIDQVREQGKAIDCFDLTQQAAAFEQNPTVAGFLARNGKSALPLVLVDGEVSLAGRYPTEQEFQRWLGAAATLQPVKKQSDCCGGCC